MARNPREGRDVFRKIGLVADRFLNISIDYIGCIPDDDYVSLSVCRQRPVIDLYPQAPASLAFQRLAGIVERWPVTRAPKGGVQFLWQRPVLS
jgi:flagellar biosynthesis protein FlhG